MLCNVPGAGKVYLRDRSSDTVLCAATVWQTLLIKFTFSSNQFADTRPTYPGTDPVMLRVISAGDVLVVRFKTLCRAQHGRLFTSCRAGLVWPRTSREHTGSFAQLL